MHEVLETSRLILREFVPEDADALARVISDPETMRFYPAPFDRAGVEEWITRNIRRYRVNGFGLWAMDLKSGEMIGDCGISCRRSTANNCRRSVITLRRDMWGHGFATEAARACRDYGFMALEADLLISLIRPENGVSWKVAEQNGMTIWKETVRVGLRHCVYRISWADWAALPGSGSALRAK